MLAETLLSHPPHSELKEVYLYLDALEVGKFELHVPVSGDLKENKKQDVRHHNSELSCCSYSTEREEHSDPADIPKVGTAGIHLSPKTAQAFQVRATQLRLHNDCCSHYRASTKLVLHPLIQSE